MKPIIFFSTFFHRHEKMLVIFWRKLKYSWWVRGHRLYIIQWFQLSSALYIKFNTRHDLQNQSLHTIDHRTLHFFSQMLWSKRTLSSMTQQSPLTHLFSLTIQSRMYVFHKFLHVLFYKKLRPNQLSLLYCSVIRVYLVKNKFYPLGRLWRQHKLIFYLLFSSTFVSSWAKTQINVTI